ncbi:uncharacterized protein LOC112022496 [Quercus suber]|uniref:uncharacterized protein LOC112022496 n=1 Tax=Quercus suber TaxID=58331 RepID=UPI0032DF2127
MASRFQAIPLVASPSYPNAVAWSDENLIAVASGHLVTILNPASPFGPRGLISVPNSEPFPIGVIDRKDLFSGCLLPNCLSRDRQPCVRSVSWSPLGMAPNSGCLLAVCTAEGRVKLYRPPFCDFGAEWIEVMDISDRLYEYLTSISFGELDVSCPNHSDATEDIHAEDPASFISKKERKRRKINKGSQTTGDQLPCQGNSENSNSSSGPYIEREGQGLKAVYKLSSDKPEEGKLHHIGPLSKCKAKSLNKMQENCTHPHKLRRSMLLAMRCYGHLQLHGHHCCSCHLNSVQFLKLAHLFLYLQLVGSLVLLATGSSDGSMRIWLGNTEELLNTSEVDRTPFFLLKEVITADSIPVSVLSLSMPAKSLHKMLLAVGKGSGSFELWNCDISGRKFDKIGSFDAHYHAVTDLAWAFDGCSLYSCSQDNFVRCWILRGSSLHEVPFPSNTPRLRSSTDVPDVFISCMGLAVSPGNLVLVMVRNLDLELLDSMYQKKAQKAVVEFFWIGGQQQDLLSKASPLVDVVEFPAFPEKELAYWESNILWSLKQYEHLDKPLVLWDIIAALLAFKQTTSKFVEHILLKWLLSSYIGYNMDLSAEKILPLVSIRLSKINSRKLHLLTIICRRVMLSELKADQVNSEVQNLEVSHGAEGEQVPMWTELLRCSERELRERLVGFGFSAFLSLKSHSTITASRPGYWYPVGLAQLEHWVALNHERVQDQLKVLSSEVGRHEKRLEYSEHEAAEQCSYCSASVPFESPEVGFCRGVESDSGTGQSHRLPRCAVSMQVCPTTPLWFCICCNRWGSRLAPETLFSMSEYPLDFKSSTESSVLEVPSKPLCPFCGLLLQRRQPDFLLSASPV